MVNVFIGAGLVLALCGVVSFAWGLGNVLARRPRSVSRMRQSGGRSMADVIAEDSRAYWATAEARRRGDDVEGGPHAGL